MGERFPDVATIETVLLLAGRAPSLHNSQPWRWQVRRSTIELFIDPSLRLPAADPDGRGMILSCGAALNHCVVALAALGWHAKVRHLPDPDDPNHLASIEIHPGDVEQTDVTLAAAIPRRRTDRRRYSYWSVPAADIALMGARAARVGVMLRRIDGLDTLHTVVSEAVFRHAGSYEYLSELTAWSGRYGSVSGVPAGNTPPPDPGAKIPARIFAGPALRQPEGAAADDRAVMLALGTETDDRLARLRAGAATSVVLLTATALGLASCPVTEPLEFADTRGVVRRDVFGTTGFPQMLLRVGWAPINADPLPATPRRDLEETVKWMIAGDHGGRPNGDNAEPNGSKAGHALV